MSIPFDFKNLNSETLSEYLKDIKQEITKTYDAIINCTSKRTFQNTVQPMINVYTLNRSKLNCFEYAKSFYPNKETRDTGSSLDCEKKKFLIDQNQRIELYDAFNDYDFESEKESLTLEERRYYEHQSRDFKRAGLHLTEGREEFIEMKKQLTEYKEQFSKNLNDENTSFEFTRQQLDGLPDTWFTEERLLKKAPKDNSKDLFKVTLKYPDYVPAMEYVKDRNVRKTLALAYLNRCVDVNSEILKKTVKLRYKMAKILGYETHADFRTEVKIVKTGKNAVDFLNNLNTLFTEMYRKDMQQVLEFAKNYEPNPLLGDVLRDWDRIYYNRLYTEKECQLDMEELKSYFPLDVVRDGIFKIYQQLLGLTFNEVETDNKWHEDVTLYSVRDQESDELMGFFYLDMYPREGKFSHAAAFDFINPCHFGKITDEDFMQPSVMTMACNFPKNECISFSDVVTFFHEFGHIMHQICSRPQLEEFCGFGVEWDFVEAPSQMLENWCYCSEPLRLMSSHKDTGESVPDEIIAKLKKMKRVLSGYQNKRQFMFGIFDLRIHTMTFNDNDDLDIQKIWYDVTKDVLEYDLTTQEGSIAPYASFGHIMGGYDAGYYGYKRAETYSANMFHVVFKENPLSKELGFRYRKKLLEPGSTKDGLELLKDFLGSDPDDKYFLLDQGL